MTHSVNPEESVANAADDLESGAAPSLPEPDAMLQAGDTRRSEDLHQAGDTR